MMYAEIEYLRNNGYFRSLQMLFFEILNFHPFTPDLPVCLVHKYKKKYHLMGKMHRKYIHLIGLHWIVVWYHLVFKQWSSFCKNLQRAAVERVNVYNEFYMWLSWSVGHITQRMFWISVLHPCEFKQNH